MMTSEEEIDALASDPAEIAARDLERLVKREGPLPAEQAVRMVRKVARAVAQNVAAERYVATASHVVWLGAVLFFSLTGKAPLAAGTRDAKSQDTAPKPSTLSHHRVSPELDALVYRCLSTSTADRFASVTELSLALALLPESQEELEDAPESSIPASAAEPTSTERASGIVRRDWDEATIEVARLVRVV